MKVLDIHKAACELAKALHKPVLYVGLPLDADEAWPDYYEEVKLAVPWLFEDYANNVQAIADGYAIVVCDSQEEMKDLYERTVGDDGPTSKNSYDGQFRVYALTINANGEPENENT